MFVFQVDLQFLKVLTGIATQGAISKETQKSYYVTTFKLEVSTNGEDWMVYRHGKNHKVSQGLLFRVLNSAGPICAPIRRGRGNPDGAVDEPES